MWFVCTVVFLLSLRQPYSIYFSSSSSTIKCSNHLKPPILFFFFHKEKQQLCSLVISPSLKKMSHHGHLIHGLWRPCSHHHLGGQFLNMVWPSQLFFALLDGYLLHITLRFNLEFSLLVLQRPICKHHPITTLEAVLVRTASTPWDNWRRHWPPPPPRGSAWGHGGRHWRNLGGRRQARLANLLLALRGLYCASLRAKC